MRYFNIKDFDCQETGNNEMSEDFLNKLDDLRHICGFPFIITSGYRDPSHSIEAQSMGFNGIGVAKTFIHVDTRKTMPVIWTY